MNDLGAGNPATPAGAGTGNRDNDPTPHRVQETREHWDARTRALPTLQSEPALLSGEILLAEVWDWTVEDPSGQPAALEDLVVAVRCP